MASIDLNEMPVLELGWKCGAAFRLSAKAPQDWNLQDHSGRATLVEGSTYIIVALPDQLDSESLLFRTHEAAQQCLDIFAIERLVALQTDRVHDHHIIWWRDANGVTLRVQFTVGLGIFGSARLTVHNPDGSLKPDDPYIPPTWDPTLRYFRLSRASRDPYQAYRDMFLALESLLSRINPPLGQNDETWWKNSLARIAGRVDLTKYLRHPGLNPVDDFYNEQYKARRCALFHAKQAHNPTVPSRLNDYELVVDALDPLTHLVAHLCRLELGSRHAGGGLAPGGLALFLDELNSNYAIAISPSTDTPPFGDLEIPDVESDWFGLRPSKLRRRKKYPEEHRFRVKHPTNSLPFTSIGSMAFWVPVDAVEKLDPISGLLAERTRTQKVTCQLTLEGVDILDIITRIVVDNPRSVSRRFVI